jgi:hypothetical protein
MFHRLDIDLNDVLWRTGQCSMQMISARYLHEILEEVAGFFILRHRT